MLNGRWGFAAACVAAVVFAVSTPILAGEHPGGEHPGGTAEHAGKPAEHPGKKAAQYTARDIKDALTSYVDKDVSLKGGYFLIYDAKNAKPWALTFSKIHDPVRVINDKSYFACTDFKSGKTVLDIDFWFEPDGKGKLKLTEIKIHKDNGKPRYTFEKDQMVEVK